MSDELDGIEVFVAVAEARGFRAAGERLGVSGSAVSQALRRLEVRFGIALVRRTTRSVHLTEAGERLFAAARPALDATNGLLIPFLALQMYFHQLIWIASLWAVTFPGSTWALAILFRRMPTSAEMSR
jgi:DNA-binding transcriptional LysR family regulator